MDAKSKSDISEKPSSAIQPSAGNTPDDQRKSKLEEGATALTETSKTKAADSVVLVNQIKGVLYGNCIGDAIGLLTEFMDKQEAQLSYGVGADLEYKQKVFDGHRCHWKEGDWTDDSDQMILILRTLVHNHGKFDEKDFANKLKYWVRHGYPELGDTGGCGLGRTTASVLSHRDFLKDPHRAARDVWEGSGRYIAPNGGVMRTSILGTMEFYDLDKVIENTKNACMVTHADPRCIASCVAVTIAIALMLQRKFELNNGEQNVEEIMKVAYCYAEKEIKDPQHKKELKEHMFAESLDKLELDSQRAIGYTFKCMGAGFWAFRQKNFREAIQAITMEAGDADTNCAVAGALLGCKVGFKKLPESWVNGLYNREWLEKEIKRYFEILALKY
ncbi:ADP-ribose glycohydrolase ARH3-like [Dendronephthya gigantea]|uniref:ADP-ribose glycohydrolase ARH3-like n=1 Tax=Dendronephthya gigantea TaxID=151771 RepID=UPI001068E2C9|nr:ADP-ribose glycohydrolase ARH3-like [Dendronephthya gigantea]